MKNQTKEEWSKSHRKGIMEHWKNGILEMRDKCNSGRPLGTAPFPKFKAALNSGDFCNHHSTIPWFHGMTMFHLIGHDGPFPESRLAAHMGNTAGVVFDHYRSLATKAEAAAYWKTKPEAEAESLRFQSETSKGGRDAARLRVHSVGCTPSRKARLTGFHWLT